MKYLWDIQEKNEWKCDTLLWNVSSFWTTSIRLESNIRFPTTCLLHVWTVSLQDAVVLLGLHRGNWLAELG